MNKTKLFLFLVFCNLLLFSCKSVSDIQKKQTDKIIATAKNYLGTKYKYGGTTKRGMDCSGLVYTSFLKNNIKLPRTSYEQSKQGKFIPLKDITKGDLLFFKNSKSQHIDHVGIVVATKGNNIQFIHSSSSKGVIVSSIKDLYWKNTFVKGQRIINIPNYSKQETQTHKVKSGDTLYGISKKYNTTVKAIKALNNLNNNTITVGMVLRVL